jgi:hypothetical protein
MQINLEVDGSVIEAMKILPGRALSLRCPLMPI